ncbi:hypothetical protein MBLNU230_g4857t1 [Neophaeotheca triangularis]
MVSPTNTANAQQSASPNDITSTLATVTSWESRQSLNAVTESPDRYGDPFPTRDNGNHAFDSTKEASSSSEPINAFHEIDSDLVGIGSAFASHHRSLAGYLDEPARAGGIVKLTAANLATDEPPMFVQEDGTSISRVVSPFDLDTIASNVPTRHMPGKTDDAQEEGHGGDIHCAPSSIFHTGFVEGDKHAMVRQWLQGLEGCKSRVEMLEGEWETLDEKDPLAAEIDGMGRQN